MGLSGNDSIQGSSRQIMTKNQGLEGDLMKFRLLCIFPIKGNKLRLSLNVGECFAFAVIPAGIDQIYDLISTLEDRQVCRGCPLAAAA